jgi:hypothetical protein
LRKGVLGAAFNRPAVKRPVALLKQSAG